MLFIASTTIESMSQWLTMYAVLAPALAHKSRVLSSHFPIVFIAASSIAHFQ